MKQRIKSTGLALVQNIIVQLAEEAGKDLFRTDFVLLVSISCQMEEIERTLEDKCRIMKLLNSYRFGSLPRTLPISGENSILRISLLSIKKKKKSKV